MANTRKRLEELTAGLVLPGDDTAPPQPPGDSGQPGPAHLPSPAAQGGDTRFPPARTSAPVPRTGPGQMLAFRGQMQAVEGELAGLRDRLQRFDGAMPSRRLDPRLVQPSRWANRHEASFQTAAFAGLKNDIEKAGGNVQPILVRELAGEQGRYELVFGHRRHRACLELGIPVLACIWEGSLNDPELFAAMDRENRERADLSPYEQGVMYQRALDEQLFPTQRKLAEHLGVSHTWIRKTLQVAQLPQAIVECFRSPLDIGHRHAEQLHAALEKDARSVLKRAEKLRGQGASASAVLARLLDIAPTPRKVDRLDLKAGDVRLGKASRAKEGGVTVELLPEGLAAVPLDQVLRSIEDVLQKLKL
ncbi:ParB/RepB/Spo0J family partition protein [Xenophilus azovorans]|uniref:ParB/RepB/Spo0J family partition protein n=1 Tax=Xenophilus azovorans TaxID=151755 RepID=UPI0009FF40A3|nr:ParB/RepB/Spo0J family partition protein [Xenophilus azovorans]